MNYELPSFLFCFDLFNSYEFSVLDRDYLLKKFAYLLLITVIDNIFINFIFSIKTEGNKKVRIQLKEENIGLFSASIRKITEQILMYLYPALYI